MPVIGTARPASEKTYFLAEGPLWDPVRERVLWVDIMAGMVHAATLRGDGTLSRTDSIEFPDTAGAVAVSENGDWVVAGSQRLYRRDADGRMTPVPTLVAAAGRRFNDGKADPAGRLVVGTKGPGDELLLQIDRDGTVRELDSDLTLSNGLGWSPDGKLLYSIDTLAQVIHVRDYFPVTGSSGPRTVFASISHGYPDGMTVDAEGYLWVAIWGGGCILRLDPSGHVVARVDVDAPQVSSVAFVGPDLDTLVITTAREGLSPDEVASQPNAGRLFTFVPGISGIAPYWWAGIDEAPSPSERKTS